MTDRDVTALLERAVADVVPIERRPTDAVMARAAARPSARLRKYLAGLVGVVVVGGGAVVVATGSDDDGRTVDAPKPLRLTVAPPEGWSAVDRPVAVDCTTELAPRTVYRDATIGDLSSCRDGGPVPAGPVLLVGRLDPAAAEEMRVVGSVTTAAGLPAYASAYDTAAAVVTWLPTGDHGDVAYTLIAPHGDDDVPGFTDLVGAGTWRAPREALAVAAQVTARGDVASEPVLPAEVSAVDLRPEPVNVDPEPGARVLDPAAVRAVVEALRSTGGGPGCGEPASARTLHVQDARTGRWSRVDVTDDGTGCRTVVSELGGSARITGDPVAVAGEAAEAPSAALATDAETVRAHGLAVAVPTGWAVERRAVLDPCTLRRPSVVVAHEFRPSCAVSTYMRPTHPYVWLTERALEEVRFTSDYGLEVRPRGRNLLDRSGLAVTWTVESLDLAGQLVDGLLGVPAEGTGRVLVVGLDEDQSAGIRESVGRG
jgi:hypothetical protein